MIDLPQIIILRQFEKQILAFFSFVRAVFAHIGIERRDEFVELIDLAVVQFFDFLPNQFQMGFAIAASDRREIGMQRAADDALESFQHFGHVPIFERNARRHELIGIGKNDIFESVQNRVFELAALEHVVAQTVYRFALGIHDVVVFEQILSDIEVASFDAFLRRFDRFRNEPRFDGDIGLFVHAEERHAIFEFLAAEDAQQIVVQRQEETACARIALTPGAPAQLIVDAARFVPFGAQDKQTADGLNFFLFFGALGLEFFQHRRIIRIGIIAAARPASQKLGIAAEQNIRPAAGHVRRYRHCPLAPGLRDDLGFALVIFRIQNVVRNPEPFDGAAENFALFDAHRADQNRLTFRMALFDLLGNRFDLYFLVKVNHVLIIFSDNRFCRRNAHDIEFVYLFEFFGFRIGRPRHAGEFVVHAEIILERDGCQCLALGLDFDAFFGFYRLMQPVRPPPAVHHAAGKIVDDDDFAIFDDIVLVEFIQSMRFERFVDVMQVFDIFRIVYILDFQVVFEFFNPGFVERHAVRFFVDRVILVAFEERNEFVDFFVKIEILFQLPRYDERRPGFVDQNRVDLVDNRIAMPALNIIRQLVLHVVAQIIEAEFVVRSVGNVAIVGVSARFVVQIGQNLAHRKPQKLVYLPHPIGVAASQIIVYRDQMRALSFQCVEIHRARGDERLAFARFHFRNHPPMQHDPADELHIIMPHVQNPPARLADRRKRLRQNIVERRAVFDHRLEFRRLRLQLLVGQALNSRFQTVYLNDNGAQFPHHALMARPEYLLK